MRESCWSLVRDFITNKELGSTFTRQDLLAFARSKDLNSDTANIHRNSLKQAGFLKSAGRGIYKYVNKIPSGLTVSELLLLKSGDTLKYLEKTVSRKERVVEKTKRDALLAEYTATNKKLLAERLAEPCKDCKNEMLPTVVKVLSYRQPPSYVRNVSQLVLGDPVRFAADLEKRDVICYNCHYIRLYKGHYSTYMREER